MAVHTIMFSLNIDPKIILSSFIEHINKSIELCIIFLRLTIIWIDVIRLFLNRRGLRQRLFSISILSYLHPFYLLLVLLPENFERNKIKRNQEQRTCEEEQQNINTIVFHSSFADHDANAKQMFANIHTTCRI